MGKDPLEEFFGVDPPNPIDLRKVLVKFTKMPQFKKLPRIIQREVHEALKKPVVPIHLYKKIIKVAKKYGIKIPKLETPKIDITKVKLPKMTLPKFKLPKLQLPKVQLPKLELPKLKLPDISGILKGLSKAGKWVLLAVILAIILLGAIGIIKVIWFVKEGHKYVPVGV